MPVGGETGHEAKCEACGASIAVVVEFGGGEYAVKVRHPDPLCADFQKRHDAEDSAYALEVVRRARLVMKR
jgi:hypothetical protein